MQVRVLAAREHGTSTQCTIDASGCNGFLPHLPCGTCRAYLPAAWRYTPACSPRDLHPPSLQVAVASSVIGIALLVMFVFWLWRAKLIIY